MLKPQWIYTTKDYFSFILHAQLKSTGGFALHDHLGIQDIRFLHLETTLSGIHGGLAYSSRKRQSVKCFIPAIICQKCLGSEITHIISVHSPFFTVRNQPQS